MFFIIFYRDEKPETASCFSYNERKPVFHLYLLNSILNGGDPLIKWKPDFNNESSTKIVRPI